MVAVQLRRKPTRSLEATHGAVSSRIADLSIRHRRLDRAMTEMITSEVDVLAPQHDNVACSHRDSFSRNRAVREQAASHLVTILRIPHRRTASPCAQTVRERIPNGCCQRLGVWSESKGIPRDFEWLLGSLGIVNALLTGWSLVRAGKGFRDAGANGTGLPPLEQAPRGTTPATFAGIRSVRGRAFAPPRGRLSPQLALHDSDNSRTSREKQHILACFDRTV
jgi:hypothetical protein